MRRIFWDAMLFSYWFSNEPLLGERVDGIRKSMRQQGDRLCSSAFVLGEVLVPALKLENQQAADAIERFFHSEVELLAFPSSAARVFALYRASSRLTHCTWLRQELPAWMRSSRTIAN